MNAQRRFMFIFTVVFLFVCSAAAWGKALEFAQRAEDLGFSSVRLARIDIALHFIS